MVTREWLMFHYFEAPLYSWNLAQIAFHFDITPEAVEGILRRICRMPQAEFVRWYRC